MSGGSYNYLYCKVQEFADKMLHSSHPMRHAFGKHLNKVADAMHDIEWVDSADYGKGDEVEAIEKVIGKSESVAELEQAIDKTFDEIENARKDLEKLKEREDGMDIVNS